MNHDFKAGVELVAPLLTNPAAPLSQESHVEAESRGNRAQEHCFFHIPSDSGDPSSPRQAGTWQKVDPCLVPVVILYPDFDTSSISSGALDTSDRATGGAGEREEGYEEEGFHLIIYEPPVSTATVPLAIPYIPSVSPTP